MRFKIKKLILVLILIGLMALSACGMGGGQDDGANTPTLTPTVPAGQAEGGNESNNPESQTELEPQPESLPEPSQGSVDACLIGTWEMDQDAFRNYMTQAMNVSDEVTFEFGEIEGSFEMVIDNDTMTYITTDPLHMEFSIIAGGTNLATMDMQVEGTGSAFYLTHEDLFIVYGQDYNFSGDGLGDLISADLLGQTQVSVTLSPDVFISMASFTNQDISHVLEIYPQLENYAVATYTCEGNVFTYQFGEYESVWLRK